MPNNVKPYAVNHVDNSEVSVKNKFNWQVFDCLTYPISQVVRGTKENVKEAFNIFNIKIKKIKRMQKDGKYKALKTESS